MSKYLYTAKDIALFFDYSDFKRSEERAIIKDLWENKNNTLGIKYRKNKYRFIKEIYRYIEILDNQGYKEELDIINKIFKEIGSNYKIGSKYEVRSKYRVGEFKSDLNHVQEFFRFIKLRLTYSNDCSHVRIKLRTLLKKLGYKRRSIELVNYIKITMKSLGLEPYLKGYEFCDIDKIKLDDILIIRLK